MRQILLFCKKINLKEILKSDLGKRKAEPTKQLCFKNVRVKIIS